MLDVTSPSTTVNTITGRELAAVIRRASAARRALIAAELAAGRIVLTQPTRRQAQLIASASYCYVSIVARLADCDRERLRNGAPLAGLSHHDMPERVIERFVVRAGVDRVFNIIDRLTKPQLVAAE